MHAAETEGRHELWAAASGSSCDFLSSEGRRVALSNPVVVQGHRARVGTTAWSSHILSSGSRDRNILQRDVRAPEDYIHKPVGHRSEVCTPTCILQQSHSVSFSGSEVLHHSCFDASHTVSCLRQSVWLYALSCVHLTS